MEESNLTVMRRILLGLIFIVFFTSYGSALSADIESGECSEGSVELISMYDSSERFSHPLNPENYDLEEHGLDTVCVDGITDAEVVEDADDECIEEGRRVGFYMSSDDSLSHFSNHEAYNLPVCTWEMETRLTSPNPDTGDSRDEYGCYESNETALFSVSDEHNAHVAEPDIFSRVLCGAFTKPENATISLEFGEDSDFNSETTTVYFEEDEVDGEQVYNPPADYPYLIAESSDYVAGIVESGFLEAERQLIDEEDRNKIVYTRDIGESVLLPFTEGDLRDIENRRNHVVEGTFLDQISPSFGYLIPSTPEVKVSLDSDADLKSNLTIGTGPHTLELEKTGEDEIEVRRRGENE